MKKSTLFIVFALCILILAGCEKSPKKQYDDSQSSSKAAVESSSAGDSVAAEENELSFLRSRISDNGSMLGIGFFGYVDSEADNDSIKAYISAGDLAKNYPFLNKCDAVLSNGAELYALVPVNDTVTVSVYPSEISESGDYINKKDNPICIGKPGETVILRCNISEICANVLICVTDGKNVIEFHPTISLENGCVLPANGCYDFSIHAMTEEERAQNASERLNSTDEVSYALQHGMSLLYTGDEQVIDGNRCLIFALGTENDEQFVREQLYAVSDFCIYTYSAASDSWEILGAG